MGVGPELQADWELAGQVPEDALRQVAGDQLRAGTGPQLEIAVGRVHGAVPADVLGQVGRARLVGGRPTSPRPCPRRSGTSGWQAPTTGGSRRTRRPRSRPACTYRRRGSYPFDAVIALYASAQPAPWGVEELHCGFPDATLHGPDVDTVIRAARFAHDRWLHGAQVLIRGQAGMNRSGLVTAPVLVMAGLTPGQAITLIRRRRGPSCPFNEQFVTWLVDHAAIALWPVRQRGWVA